MKWLRYVPAIDVFVNLNINICGDTAVTDILPRVLFFAFQIKLFKLKFIKD